MSEQRESGPLEEPAVYRAGTMTLRIPQDASFKDASELADLVASDYTDVKVERHNPELMLAGGPGADFTTLWITVQVAFGVGAAIAAKRVFERIIDDAYDALTSRIGRLVQRAHKREPDINRGRVSFTFTDSSKPETIEFSGTTASDLAEFRRAARAALQFLEVYSTSRDAYPDLVYLEWNEASGTWGKPEWLDALEIKGPKQPDP